MGPKRDAGTLTPPTAFWFQSFVAVVCRPHLWWVAILQYRSFVPDAWWRRPPFLPLPARNYVRFRLETAYGHAGEPSAVDLVRYLEWCRDARRARRT